MSNSNRYGLGRSHERSPLIPPRSSTSNDSGFGPAPPPPYEAVPAHSSGGYQANNVHQPRRDPPPSPLRPAAITKSRHTGRSVVFLIVLAQAVAFFFLYEAGHLESERRLLEREKEEMRKERERLEKSRGDIRIPQGAFWDPLLPTPDCRAYGKREYHGALKNIPEDRIDMDACMNMPVEIKGVTLKRPHRCGYVDGSSDIHGFWMVDWDQPDCKPWHQDVADKGCLHPGSRTRRIEAWVVDINDKPEQDWRLLCESTPFTWKRIRYSSPTHCEARWFGMKFAMWDIFDDSC